MQQVYGHGDRLIAIEYLTVLQEIAFERGLSSPKFLKQSGLKSEILIKSDSKVGHLSFIQACNNLLNHIPDPNLPYVYASKLTTAKHGRLGLGLHSCPNLLSACELLAKLFPLLIQGVDLSFTQDSDYAYIEISNIYSNPNENFSGKSSLAEWITITVLCSSALQIQLFIGQQRKIELEFDFPSRGATPETTCPSLKIEYSKYKSQIRIPNALLECKPSLFDPDPSHILLGQCEREFQNLIWSGNYLISAVRESILTSAKTSWPNLEIVASDLAMSPTTLRRKLKENKTNFQEIKNAIRYQKATSLLETRDNSIESIAFELGFDNSSNFSKAFKSWTGLLPKEYAKKLNKNFSS